MSRPEEIRAAIAAGDFASAAREFEAHVFELRVAVRHRRCSRREIEEAGELVQAAREARERLRTQAYIHRAYGARAG